VLRGRSKVVLCAAVLALLFLRRPDQFLHPQLWAEDGPVFFLEAYRAGVASLFERYAGYYLSIPRCIALAGSILPVRIVPAWFVIASAALTTGVCVWAASRRVPATDFAKVAMALLVVAVPVPNEIFLNLTNVQWITALGLVLVAVSLPAATPWERAFDAAAVAVLGLTGPFVILLLPLFVTRSLRFRDRHAIVLLVIALACSAIQARGLSPDRSTGPIRLGDPAFHAIIPKVVLILATGRFGPVPGRTALQDAVTGAALLFLVVLVLRAVRTKDLLLFDCIAGAAAVLGASAYAFRGSPAGLLSSPRYFYLPSVLLLWAVLRLPRRVGFAIAAVSFAAFLLSRYPPQPLVDYRWDEASRCIGKARPCRVPINPPGWFLDVD
jgi:hypothetical protein